MYQTSLNSACRRRTALILWHRVSPTIFRDSSIEGGLRCFRTTSEPEQEEAVAKLRIDNHRATDLTLLGDKPNCESLQICLASGVSPKIPRIATMACNSFYNGWIRSLADFCSLLHSQSFLRSIFPYTRTSSLTGTESIWLSSQERKVRINRVSTRRIHNHIDMT